VYGLKAIFDGHFFVFTQPGPKANVNVKGKRIGGPPGTTLKHHFSIVKDGHQIPSRGIVSIPASQVSNKTRNVIAIFSPFIGEPF